MNSMVLRNLSYGVYIVSTLDGKRPTGCTANSIMQITSSPATLAVSINHDNYTNQCIEACGQFAVSILREDSDPGIIGTFGFQSGKTADKFEQTAYEEKGGLPVVTDSCGYMCCKVIDKLETSTHTIFIGEIVDGDINAGTPMTYAYYHKVVKGKSPKNAPTYIPEEDEKTPAAVWQCSICGYIYDGDAPFEELPDSYTCPICKQPKSVFVKKD